MRECRGIKLTLGGFSVLELMIVISVLGILGALTVGFTGGGSVKM
jgi:prepilin-type N-terminal cleavage/methylation domain-containing protein